MTRSAGVSESVWPCIFYQLLLIPLITFVVAFFFRPKDDYLGMSGFFFVCMGWSVTQLLYMIPAVVLMRRSGRNEVAKGIIIVAAVGVLINGTCDALLFGRNLLFGPKWM